MDIWCKTRRFSHS